MRDPRWQEYTICTAVAPDDVFAVRTYGTRPLCGPGLVRKISFSETTNPQVTRPRTTRTPFREATQVSIRCSDVMPMPELAHSHGRSATYFKRDVSKIALVTHPHVPTVVHWCSQN